MLRKITESFGIKNPSTYKKSAYYRIIICVTYRLISRGSMRNGKGKKEQPKGADSPCSSGRARSVSPNDTPHPLRRHFVLLFSVLMGASLILTMSAGESRGIREVEDEDSQGRDRCPRARQRHQASQRERQSRQSCPSSRRR